VTETSGRTLEVAPAAGGGVDAGTVLAVTSALAGAGHGDAEVELHRRTLEDVFLELTGRGLRSAEAAP
ncbi:hypothetical protein PU560_06180, partial [Georgenia sp. 10Sc9-8]|nr:hypothetical protein [Georgenia halotolerans]